MGLYEIKNTFRDLGHLNFKGLYHEGKNQTKLGLAMTKNRRMHFIIEKIKGLSEIKRLYKKAKKMRDSKENPPDRG
jgi:hypothetical protein